MAMRHRRKPNPIKEMNRYGVGTIYVPKSGEHLWLKAAEVADSVYQSRSQYILALIEKDLKKRK